MNRWRTWAPLLLCSLLLALVVCQRDRFQYIKHADGTWLYRDCNTENCSYWKGFEDDYPSSEQSAATNFFKDSLSGKTAQDRSLVIARNLYRRFARRIDEASPQLYGRSPWQQFSMLETDSSLRLQCGNLAQQFAFFCSVQGIMVRMIEIYNPGDHHVLNEVFLPETGKWAAVDVTMGRFFFFDSAGAVLSFMDLQRKLSAGETVHNRTMETNAVLSPISYEAEHYYTSTAPVQYFARLEGPELYRISNKIRRFLLPENWYVVYGKPNIPWPYLFKVVVVIGWIWSLIKLLANLLKRK